MRVFKINDKVVTLSSRWSLKKRLNARSTFTAQVTDLKSLSEIVEGMEVSFTDGASVIFKGIVDKVNDFEETPNQVEYQINCVDFNALADRALVAEAGTNEEVSAIVKNKILPYMTSDGVTEGTIETGTTLTKYTFNYKKPSRCLDQLQDITGYNWNIDNDKKLNFYPKGVISSPFDITDTTRVLKFKRQKALTQYRNVQYIRAGKGKTSTQTDAKPTPKPDGVSRTFFVDYPIAEKPTIKINSTAIDSDDVGIRGSDDDKKYYYKIGDNYITQDEGETLLESTDLIEITYIGEYDILVQAEKDSEIIARATIEGTSGRYEHIQDEKSFTESDEALDYANGLLDKYGEVCDVVDFTTFTNGLGVGQQIHITKTNRNIDSDFLIESISVRAYNQEYLEYSVKCIDGVALGGWENFFKRLLDKQRENVVNENEKLIKLKKIGNDNVTVSETVTITESTPESRVGFAMVGFSEVG